jgi:transposase InsO family protein
MKVLGLKSLIRLKNINHIKENKGRYVYYSEILRQQHPIKWATDITEFNISGNKLYLSPIIDLFNGEIISYELSERQF